MLDPQGKAVHQALTAMGFSEVKDVRMGKYLELELASGDKPQAEAKIKTMCEKLLANTVIEEYRFEIFPS